MLHARVQERGGGVVQNPREKRGEPSCKRVGGGSECAKRLGGGLWCEAGLRSACAKCSCKMLVQSSGAKASHKETTRTCAMQWCQKPSCKRRASALWGALVQRPRAKPVVRCPRATPEGSDSRGRLCKTLVQNTLVQQWREALVQGPRAKPSCNDHGNPSCKAVVQTPPLLSVSPQRSPTEERRPPPPPRTAAATAVQSPPRAPRPKMAPACRGGG